MLERIRKFAVAMSAAATLAWLVFCTGPRDAAIYPPAEESPYLLPWKAGEARWVAQGNRSMSTHRGFYEFGWDFVMPVGTPVYASRGGTVIEVVQHLDGAGFFHGNQLKVDHGDGTVAVYAHIKLNGAQVRVGQHVARGELIALSGAVGAAVFPHLHFHVERSDGVTTVPISFHDVPGGVPLAARSYMSRNGG